MLLAAGSPQMAAEELAKVNRYASPMIVKLWSEMGDLPRALAEAEKLARLRAGGEAYLAAGDACRLHGQFERAIEFYEKALAAPQRRGHHGRLDNERARASIAAIRVFDTLDLSCWPRLWSPSDAWAAGCARLGAARSTSRRSTC